MYPSVDQIVRMAGQNDSRPIIMCEYAHSMGNATGNFAEYWAAIRSHRRLQGGFIWDWVDQGFRRIAPDGQIWYAYGGDFGDEPNDGAFCLNGLVDAGRAPRPALWECKKVLESVSVTPIDLAAGVVRIHNEHSFLNLHHLIGTWSLTCGRTVLAQGVLPPLSAPPGASETVALSLGSPSDCATEECWLDIRFQLAQATLWAPAGHVVAWSQLAWPSGRPHRRPIISTTTGTPALQETDEALVVQGADWQMRFDRQSGRLSPFFHQGHTLFSGGPHFTFWRAPTDNDIGTYGAEKMYFAWHDAGLDRLEETVLGVESRLLADRATITVRSRLAPRAAGGHSAWWGWLKEQLHLLLVQCWGPAELQQIAAEFGMLYETLPGIQKSAKVAALIARLDGEQRGRELVATVYRWLIDTTDPEAFSSLKVRLDAWRQLDPTAFAAEFSLRDQIYFDCTLTYAVQGDGAIHLRAETAPYGALPPLPRIGLAMELPAAFEHFTWYGRGPGESYPDRQQGSAMGVYAGRVDDQFVAYGRPQENGNKSDVRWATLTDAAGNGLWIAGDRPLNVSAHRFAPGDLSKVRHPHELVRREEIFLTVDFAHAGLGNASCGPGVLPQYQIPPEAGAFELWLCPVAPAHAEHRR
jgi:beta-galactosidase/beta-glucuronidase